MDCLSQLFKTRNLVLELAHVEDEKELDFHMSNLGNNHSGK
jgi:hypothetical protein